METDHQHRHSSGDVELRPPTDDDLEVIQAGWGRAVPHDSLGNWAVSARDLVLPEEDGSSRVATINDRVIGFASVIGGALRGIYVEDPYRRQGVGDTLLAGIIEFAQGKGWHQLTVANCHDWVGTMPGIDVRYENTVGFLEHRGFERGGHRCDVEADFPDIEAAARQRPLEGVCAVSAYHPDALEEMKAFDERDETHWNWVEWVGRFPLTDPNRVRLIARVAGQLVGCIDAKISHGVAGLAFISVDPAYRRQGIGSALLREAASECKQRGATSMFAGMARRELYEANGWRVHREFVEMTRQL